MSSLIVSLYLSLVIVTLFLMAEVSPGRARNYVKGFLLFATALPLTLLIVIMGILSIFDALNGLTITIG